VPVPTPRPGGQGAIASTTIPANAASPGSAVASSRRFRLGASGRSRPATAWPAISSAASASIGTGVTGRPVGTCTSVCQAPISPATGTTRAIARAEAGSSRAGAGAGISGGPPRPAGRHRPLALGPRGQGGGEPLDRARRRRQQRQAQRGGAVDRNERFDLPNFLNWSVALSREVAGFTLTVGYYDTDIRRSQCGGGQKICDARAMFTISRAF